jgi:hypothetical protein
MTLCPLIGPRFVLFALEGRRFCERRSEFIPFRPGIDHLPRMNRSRASRRTRCIDAAAFPDDPYDYALAPERRPGRPMKHDLIGWRVVDDWPERVPLTEREVDVFEAWFGDILDEFFGSR